MNWLCWHVGTTNDPIFRIIARSVGLPVHLVLAVWAALLEHAAETAPRGSTVGFDPETVGEAIGSDADAVTAIVCALEAKKKIEGARIANWEKRQNQSSAERAKAWRENKKNSGEQNERRERSRAFKNVTNGHTYIHTYNKNGDGNLKEVGAVLTATVPGIDWVDTLNRHKPGKYWPETKGTPPERDGPWDAPKPLVLAWRKQHGIGQRGEVA